MTLPSSGPLSLSQIQGEFGGSNPISLSEYYGAASGVPSSGPISIGDFYGKSNGITYVASSGYSAGDFIALSTFTIPSQRVSGDLLLIVYCQTVEGQSNVQTPSGWNGVFNTARQGVFWRISNGTETTAVVQAQASNGRFGSCSVFRNAKYGRLATFFSTNGNQNPPAVTAVAGGMVIAALHNVTGSETISSNPSGYSTVYAPGPRASGSYRSARKAISSSGSENPGTFGGSISGDTRLFSIAVDPK